MDLDTPDLTAAQVSAVGGLLSTLLGAAAILDRWEFITVAGCLTLLAVAVVISDAVIRHGRSNVAASHAFVEAVDAGATIHDFPGGAA